MITYICFAYRAVGREKASTNVRNFVRGFFVFFILRFVAVHAYYSSAYAPFVFRGVISPGETFRVAK